MFNRFNIVIAHYIFCEDHHDGQASALYERLCRISRYFKPSPLMSHDINDHDDEVKDIYVSLCEKYGFNY